MRFLVVILRKYGLLSKDVVIVEQTEDTFKKTTLRQGTVYFQSGLTQSQTDELMAREVGHEKNDRVVRWKLEN